MADKQGDYSVVVLKMVKLMYERTEYYELIILMMINKSN